MSLCSDFKDKLWIGHFDGINIMDKKTQRISDFKPGNSSRFTKTCTALFEDSQQRMWIGTSDGFFLYNREKNSLTSFV